MASLEISTNIACRVQCDFCPQELLIEEYSTRNNLKNISYGQPVQMSLDTFKKCVNKLPKSVLIEFIIISFFGRFLFTWSFFSWRFFCFSVLSWSLFKNKISFNKYCINLIGFVGNHASTNNLSFLHSLNF